MAPSPSPRAPFVTRTRAAALRWKPSDGLLDFTAVYSDGEYAHKYYTGRRLWGVYRLLASKQKLSPDYDEYLKSRPYPVSAPADKKLSVADVAAAMRAHLAHDHLRVIDLFHTLDVDGSGALSRREFSRMIGFLGLDADTRDVDDLSMRVDADKNGKVTFKEFNAAFKSNL